MRLNPVRAACRVPEGPTIQLHGSMGVSSSAACQVRPATAEFTYYPANTVRSGFHVNLEVDRDTTKTYMVNAASLNEKRICIWDICSKKTTFHTPLEDTVGNR